MKLPVLILALLSPLALHAQTAQQPLQITGGYTPHAATPHTAARPTPTPAESKNPPNEVPQPKDQPPTQAGVYYQSPSGYIRIERSMESGIKTSGVAKSAFSYGIAKVGGSWVYSGASAPTQVTNRSPILMVVVPAQMETSLNDIKLLRMSQKKNHREVLECKASVWSGVDQGNKDIVPTRVTRTPEGNITIITSDLQQGEYLLVTDRGNGAFGYDFGVR